MTTPNEKLSGFQQSLTINLCQSIQDAYDQGFVYRPPEYQPARIQRVVVVKNGMGSGNASVDLVFRDEAGQQYMVMLNGVILGEIARIVDFANERGK